MNETNQSQGQTQNALTKKPWYKKWWVIVIGVFILLSIIGNSSEDKSNKQATQEEKKQPAQNTEVASVNKNEEKPAEPAAKAAPQVTVTGAVISKDYSENEVSADEKYKGKLIELSGKVYSVDNGTFDNEIIIKLSDGKYDMSGAMCYMKDTEKSKVLAFKKGQQVTLIGTGNSATIGSPMLKDCTVK